MSRVILDASAITAVLRREPGHENVLPVLRGSLVSVVNLAEVFCSTRTRKSDPEHDALSINMMQLERIPFDEEQANIVSSIYMSTLGSSVGLADRACLALGLSRGLPVMTSDRDWLRHDIGVEVRLFRHADQAK